VGSCFISLCYQSALAANNYAGSSSPSVWLQLSSGSSSTVRLAAPQRPLSQSPMPSMRKRVCRQVEPQHHTAINKKRTRNTITGSRWNSEVDTLSNLCLWRYHDRRLTLNHKLATHGRKRWCRPKHRKRSHRRFSQLCTIRKLSRLRAVNKGCLRECLEIWPSKAETVVRLVELIITDVCHLAVIPEASYIERNISSS